MLKCAREAPQSSVTASPLRVAAAKTVATGLSSVIALIVGGGLSGLVGQLGHRHLPAEPEPALAVTCECSCPPAVQAECPGCLAVQCRALELPPAPQASWQLSYWLAIVAGFLIGICGGGGS